MSVACDPDGGTTTSRQIPPEKDISFHCTLPWNTFHDVFWGYAHPRVLVMGGGVKVKHWRYRAAYNFGISFDMTSDCWVKCMYILYHHIDTIHKTYSKSIHHFDDMIINL